MKKFFNKIKDTLFQSYYDRNFRKKEGPRYSRTDKLENNEMYIEAEKEDYTPEFHNEEFLELLNMANDMLDIKKSKKDKESVIVIVKAGSEKEAQELINEVKEFETFKNKNIIFTADINECYSGGMKLINTPSVPAEFTGVKSAYDLIKERNPDITLRELLDNLSLDIPKDTEVKRVIYRDDKLGWDGIPTYVVERASKDFITHKGIYEDSKLNSGQIVICYE